MNKKQALESPVAWVLGGALISSWLFGVVHAYMAHGPGRTIAALLLPPYGIYLAVEQQFEHPVDVPLDSAQARQAAVAPLVEACRTSDVGREKSGLSAVQYDVWCDCTWQMAVENWPPDESRYIAANGRNSPAFFTLLQNVRASCRATAQYLGGQEAAE